MLTIPSTLLSKLNSRRQTIGNNANPQMDIIAQKAAKYLNQGSFLTPKTIRTGNSLGPLDICIRREDPNAEPTEIVMLYIENDMAKVATLPYVSRPDEVFEYQYTVGPATDVACDFDGRWSLVTDRTGIYFNTEIIWSLVTFGEPYFVLNNAGTLVLYQGQTAITTLAQDTAVKVAMLRGWKSVNHVLTDQGIICCYTRTDGKVYYRAYVEQEDDSFIWENEYEITEFTPPVTNIGLFLCADYRTGFLAEISGEVHMMVTKRSWSAMASLPEYITASVVEATVDVIDLGFYDLKSTDEYIITSNHSALILPYGDISPTMWDAWNYDDGNGDYGYYVCLRWTDSVDQALPEVDDFTMTDGYGMTYYPQDIIRSDYPNRVLLHFMNFNNALNPLVLHYTPGSLTWNGSAIAADTVPFNATNLVPYYVDPPVVTSIYSVDNRTIRVEFDRPIVQLLSQNGFAVSGFEPFTSPGGALIPTNYVNELVSLYDTYTVQIYLTYAGRMKHPQGDVTLLFTGQLLGVGGALVNSFSESFIPTGLTLWFKPNDPEYIQIGFQDPIVTVFDVVYLFAKNGDEYLKVGYHNATITITNVGGIPL